MTVDATEAVNTKNEAQAKNAILNMFTELKVQKIVYVDDRCSINELKASYLGKLKGHYAGTKPAEIDFVDWNLAEAPFQDAVTKIWDDANDEKRRELFLKILTFENNVEDLENSVAPLKLKDILKEKIDLLSPTEWLAKKAAITETLTADTKILFLFDIEFANAPLHDGRDGRDLALDLLNNQSISKFLYCGIFSHLFNVSEEYDKRREYAHSHGLKKEAFYTISKKRFQNSSYLPGLAEGIRNALLINEVEVLKRETSKILRSSYTSSINEINGLTPESFNQIIQRSSKIEGVWEMTTLIRISNLITSYEALTKLLPDSPRKRINKSLEKIRQVEQIKTGSETAMDKQQVLKLRDKELYINDEILNQLHYPVSNGDIFKIQNKEYILLVQPCNVALRSNGSRDRNYNTGFLIELETINLDMFSQYKKGQLTTLEVIESVTLPPGFIKISRFSSFQSISLSPLDLTVFNKDGKSRIALSQTENTSIIIQESWKKRYKVIQKEFVEFQLAIKAYKNLGTAKKSTLKKAVFTGSLFTGYGINNESALSINGKLLEFDIARISHYRSPYSDDLLQKFMLYLSRNAFDRDFSS